MVNLIANPAGVGEGLPVLSTPTTVSPAHLTTPISPVVFRFPFAFSSPAQYIKLYLRLKTASEFTLHKVLPSSDSSFSLPLTPGVSYVWKWQPFVFLGAGTTEVALGAESGLYEFKVATSDNGVGDIGNGNPVGFIPSLETIKTVIKNNWLVILLSFVFLWLILKGKD